MAGGGAHHAPQPGGQARSAVQALDLDIVAESQWTVNIFTISCICAQKQYVNFRSPKHDAKFRIISEQAKTGRRPAERAGWRWTAC